MKGKQDKPGKHISDLGMTTENVAKQSSEDLILIIKEEVILEICVCISTSQHKVSNCRRKTLRPSISKATIQKQARKGNSRREETKKVLKVV